MADRSRSRTRTRLALAALVVLGVAVGAFAGRWAPAPQLGAARARWAAEAAAIDSSLTALEDRLLADQARVRLWGDMRSRHETVSQVACENLDGHAKAMLAAFERTKEQVSARKHSLASAAEPRASARRERF